MNILSLILCVNSFSEILDFWDFDLYTILMAQRRGFTFIEIIVSSLLLITGIAILISVYLGFLNLITKLHYRNVAYNLLRDVVEYAETEYVTAGCTCEYKYNNSSGKYGSECVGTNCANPFSLDPFSSPDGKVDIKTKGYVPKSDPDSVVITYEAQTKDTMPDGSSLLIIWRGACGGTGPSCSYDINNPPPPCGPLVCNPSNRVSGTTCTGVITGSTNTCSCRMLCKNKEYYQIFAKIQWREEGRTFHEELRVVPVGYNKQPGITVQLGEFTEE